MQTLTALRAQAKNNGIADMNPDDVNKEIGLARMKAAKSIGNYPHQDPSRDSEALCSLRRTYPFRRA